MLGDRKHSAMLIILRQFSIPMRVTIVLLELARGGEDRTKCYWARPAKGQVRCKRMVKMDFKVVVGISISLPGSWLKVPKGEAGEAVSGICRLPPQRRSPDLSYQPCGYMLGKSLKVIEHFLLPYVVG